MQLQLNKENFHQTLNRFSTTELETLIEKFPYFQQAHLLLAKKYQQENNPRFDEQLQMAALYTQDRDLLFAIFNEKSLSSQLITPETIKPVEETIVEETAILEVVKEDVPVQEVVEEVKVEMPVEQGEKIFTAAETVNPIEEIKPSEVPVEQEEEVFTPTQAILPMDEVIAEKPVIEAKEEVETDPQTIEEVEEEVIEETFNTHEPHTFDEWLKAFAQPKTSKLQFVQEELPAEPEQLDEELNKMILQSAVTNLQELVEESTNYSKGLNEFISEQIQKHKPVQTKVVSNENEMPAEIATETLAKLYEAQKKYQKAIRVYEVLRLKYPRKNDFFAARINELKNLL